MSVFVLTEGGRDKGFGHVARCLAISDALKNLSQGNCDVKFIINGDNSVQSIFGNREVGLEIYPWHAEIDRLEQEISSVDRVLIDSYLADTETYSRISEKVNKRMLIIDDYCRIQYPEGIVVNPTLLSKELGYAKNKDTKYLLGSEYAILREEFFDVPSRKVNADIKDILITMGATEHLDCIGGIVESLSEKGDFKFHVIAGRPDFHSKVEGVLIEKGYGAKVDIYSGLSAGEMRDLMLKCDVAISGGGQTLNELACCGTPVIGICLAQNQKLNLESWEKIGSLDFAGWETNKEIFDEVKMIFEGMTFERRSEMSKLGRNLVDGKGALRISREFLRL